MTTSYRRGEGWHAERVIGRIVEYGSKWVTVESTLNGQVVHETVERSRCTPVRSADGGHDGG